MQDKKTTTRTRIDIMQLIEIIEAGIQMERMKSDVHLCIRNTTQSMRSEILITNAEKFIMSLRRGET